MWLAIFILWIGIAIIYNICAFIFDLIRPKPPRPPTYSELWERAAMEKMKTWMK